MNIIDMTYDFKEVCKSIKNSDNQTAFESYYKKYKSIFDSQIYGLYRMSYDEFKALVQSTDFSKILERVNKVDNKIIEKIKDKVIESVKDLGFSEDFDLYLGVGLGHICGAALPNDKPMIYFGLECLEGQDIDYLIPHEVNHMVRINSIKDINLDSFLERVISEGLGVIYPLVLNKFSFDNYNISKTLGISQEQLEILNLYEGEIKTKVINNIYENINYQLNDEFFTIKAGANRAVALGYYIGFRIIENALNRGYSIKDLTILNVSKFIDFI